MAANSFAAEQTWGHVLCVHPENVLPLPASVRASRGTSISGRGSGCKEQHVDFRNQVPYQALEVLSPAVDSIFKIFPCNDSFIVHKVQRVPHGRLVPRKLGEGHIFISLVGFQILPGFLPL